MRQYIRDMVSTGESYKVKLRSVGTTTQKLIEALTDDIQLLKVQLQEDRATADRIQQQIVVGKVRSQTEINTLVSRLSDRYDTIASRIKLEFRDSLSVVTVLRRSFERALDSEKERFKEDVTDRLNQKLSLIYEEVERIFVQFYDYVERETAEVAPVLALYDGIQTDATDLFNDMTTQDLLK